MAVATSPITDPLNALIDGTAHQLDIPRALHDAAVKEYQVVGAHLGACGTEAGIGINVYPQGSFALGTVVRPLTRNEYDIDLVCLFDVHELAVAPEQLKLQTKRALEQYAYMVNSDGRGPVTLDDGKRALTLIYERRGFHLDVLPVVLDTEAESPTAVLLPDKDLVGWQQHSDPIAFAAWFMQIARRIIALKEARAYVAGVPEFGQRTALQRAVQVLKRHRDIFFKDDEENRPPSIIITTIAALGYEGETNVYDAVVNVTGKVERFIKTVNGTWWLPNPVQEQENFVDRWNTHPMRRLRFEQWLVSLRDELRAAQGEGLPSAIRRFQLLLGEEPVNKAAGQLGSEYATLRNSGALVTTGGAATLGVGDGTRVRPHQFYGSQ